MRVASIFPSQSLEKKKLPNYSFQIGRRHSFANSGYIWFGVIQNLQNKYLIWFDWEHTSPLRLSDATEAAEYISTVRESEDIFFAHSYNISLFMIIIYSG